MIWLIVGLCLALSVTLLCGKGAFLIAGYNTASAAEKQKYDEKKLCRVMGGGMSSITVMLALFAFAGDNPPKVLIVAMFVVIVTTTIGMLVLSNTVCKVKTAPALPAAENPSKRPLIAAGVIVAVVLVAVGVMLFTGEIASSVEDGALRIKGSYWSDYTLPLEQVTAVSYLDSLEIGRRTNGLGSFKLNEGHFRNEQFGNYILYAYLSCDQYVLLATERGMVVLNEETPEETMRIFEQLREAVG